MAEHASVWLIHATPPGVELAAAVADGLELLGVAAVPVCADSLVQADGTGCSATVICDRAAEPAARSLGVPCLAVADERDLEAADLAQIARLADALDGMAPSSAPAAFEPAAASLRGGPTIVVPVHGALDDVSRCVASVLANTTGEYRLLLIDDGTPEPAATFELTRLADTDDRIELIAREHRGYTATINEGCRAAEGDVVLLNSDTEVSPGWLDRLAAVAYSRQDVATVTPVSNAAGAFSVPNVNVNAELPAGFDVATMDRLVRALSDRARPVVPTGNGFCMYIRRQAFEAVGYFDEAAFPNGYCEENDFCMRAAAVGLVNLIDDATFIYHRRSGSFGEGKAAIMAASRAMLDQLHPSYASKTRAWLSGPDALVRLRRELATLVDAGPAAAVAAVTERRPVVLFVLHAGAGGTPQTNADLMRSLEGRFRCLLLRCDLESFTLEDVEGAILRCWDFSVAWDPQAGLQEERVAALVEAIHAFNVGLVHVRSLVALAPEYLAVVADAGLPCVVSFHDFYAVCPTIQLLDERYEYCGGNCTSGPGPCRVVPRWFRQPIDGLKHGYVRTWRERMREGLRHAAAYVTTSQTARDVVGEHFPEIRDHIRIIEHGRDTGRYQQAGVRPVPGERQRVVAFGALGRHKGIDLIEAVMKLDQEAGGRFEFHFVGQLHGAWHPEQWGGVVYGPYDRDSLGDLLAEIAPSYALITSLWPETYCHTLTEAWACGLPVFASDIGTLRERVRRHGGGWLLDQTDPAAWYSEMRRVANNTLEWDVRAADIAMMAPRTVDRMALDYADLYDGILRPGDRAPLDGWAPPSDSWEHGALGGLPELVRVHRELEITRRDLDATNERVLELEDAIETLFGGLHAARGDIARAAASRAWRLGHGATKLARRATFRATRTEGALASALQRIDEVEQVARPGGPAAGGPPS